MKTENPGVIITIKNNSGGVFPAHRFVSQDGTMVNTAEDYNTVVGVSLQSAEDGELIPVAISGVVLVEAGTTISLPQKVMSDGGYASPMNNPDPPTTQDLFSAVGVALDSASSMGDLIRVKLF